MRLVYVGPEQEVMVTGIPNIQNGVPFECSDELGASLMRSGQFEPERDDDPPGFDGIVTAPEGAGQVEVGEGT